MPTTKTRFISIRLLPLLHLCACLTIAIVNSDWWGIMFVVDLPISVLITPLFWYIRPMLAFGIVGTVWWYLLSRLIVRLIVRQRRDSSPENANPSDEATAPKLTH
jgi:hypothetical protein